MMIARSIVIVTLTDVEATEDCRRSTVAEIIVAEVKTAEDELAGVKVFKVDMYLFIDNTMGEGITMNQAMFGFNFGFKSLLKSFLLLFTFLIATVTVHGTFADDTGFSTPDLINDDVVLLTTNNISNLLDDLTDIDQDQLTIQARDILVHEIAQTQSFLGRSDASLFDVHSRLEQLAYMLTMLEFSVTDVIYITDVSDDVEDVEYVEYDEVEVELETFDYEPYLQRLTDEASEILERLTNFVMLLNEDDFTEITWNELSAQLQLTMSVFNAAAGNEMTLQDFHYETRSLVTAITKLEEAEVAEVAENVTYESDEDAVSDEYATDEDETIEYATDDDETIEYATDEDANNIEYATDDEDANDDDDAVIDEEDAIDSEINNEDDNHAIDVDFEISRNMIAQLNERGLNQIEIHWQANNEESHLALDPANANWHSFTLQMNFTPGTTNIYAPGEIEIRIPRFPLRERDGSGHGTFLMQLPTNSASIHASGFWQSTDGDYIVLRNNVSFSGERNSVITVQYNYRAPFIENGFESNFQVQANIGGQEVVSNELSLDMTTRVVVNNVAKTSSVVYHFWLTEWGPRPEGYNPGDFVYIAYRITAGVSNRTTQPFVRTLIETPENDGELIAWIGGDTPNFHWLNVAGWGNIDDFHNRWGFDDRMSTPGGMVNHANYTLQLMVLIRYPRTGELDQLVGNSVTVSYRGIDFEYEEDNLTSSARATRVINDFEFVAPPGNYLPIKHMYSRTNRGDINILEIRRPTRLQGFAGGHATGFEGTQNGTRPFRTTVIDDYMFLETSTGWHRLYPGDYQFVNVDINSYNETVLVRNNAGNIIGTERMVGSERSPIRLYYLVEGNPEWQYLRTFDPGGLTNSPTFPLPMDQIVYKIKAVHDNGFHTVRFNMGFNVQLNPTDRVVSLLEGEEFVRLINFSSLQVTVHNEEGLEIRHLNAVSGSSYGGSFFEEILEKDLEFYGRPVMRASHYTTLRRMSTENLIVKSSQHQRDAANMREIINYTIVARMRPQNVASITEDHRTLLEEYEHRAAVFYDLLPQGAFIDPYSVRVHDATFAFHRPNDSLVDHELHIHENWRGSGQTLIEIHVWAREGRRNIGGSTITSQGFTNLPGTGFNVHFTVFYPWESIVEYGNNLRNIAAYQVRNGSLAPGAFPDNAENFLDFTLRERELMSNLAPANLLDPHELNTIYTQHSRQVDAAIATSTGLTKMVRPADRGEQFREHTRIVPGNSYEYRLRFQNDELNEVTNLVLFDVLEAAHGGAPHWRGTFESIDVSQPERRGIAPRIFFSTQSGLNPVTNVAHANLANTTIWTTTQPANRADITAIAIDLSMGENGEPFTIEPNTAISIYIRMTSPTNYPSEEIALGTLAHNDAAYRLTITPIYGGNSTNRPTNAVPPVTVELVVPDLNITKRSDPVTGTLENPALVEPESTITYTIAIRNNDTRVSVSNVVANDVIPNYLSINISEESYVKGFFGNNSADAIRLSASQRVSYSITGNRIDWTISILRPGETFTLIIPTTVRNTTPLRTVIINQAFITEVNNRERVLESEITYHIVDRLDLVFIKTDDQNQPLSGAEFALFAYSRGDWGWWNMTPDGWDEDPRVPFATAVSDENGVVRFSRLERDMQYRLIETYAPAGFTRPTGRWTINVRMDATITISRVMNSGHIYTPNFMVCGDAEHAFCEDENTRFLRNLRLLDLEFVKTNYQEIPAPLPGAEFALFAYSTSSTDWGEMWNTTPDGWHTDPDLREPLATVTSDENGVVRFENIIRRQGQYRLVETQAPAGYVTPSGHWRIMVGPTGMMNIFAMGTGMHNITNCGTAEYAFCEDANTRFLRNSLIVDFEFIKINDHDLPIPLAGAEFAILRYNRSGTGFANGPAGGWLNPYARAVSDENGVVRFEGLSADARYRLSERRAPDGFNTPTGHWTINVSASGEITIEAVNAPEFIRCDSSDYVFCVSEGGLFLRNYSDIGITKTSDPASGTEAYPTEVYHSDVIYYSIAIRNRLEDETINQIIVRDDIPSYLTINVTNPNLLQGFFGSDAQAAQPLSAINRVNATIDGQRVEWTITYLEPGEVFTLIIPTTVRETAPIDTVIINQAFIISVDGYETRIPSEETYHIVRDRDDFDFEFFKTDEGIYDTSDNFNINNVLRLNGAVFMLERCISTPEAATCEDDEWELVGEATSGEDANGNAVPGLVHFEGVTANTLYRLTETQAPTTPRIFRLPDGHWYIRLDDDGYMAANYPRATDGGWILAFRQYPLNTGVWFVGNMTEVDQFPASGGIGTIHLLILGTLALTVGGFLYAKYRTNDLNDLEKAEIKQK